MPPYHTKENQQHSFEIECQFKNISSLEFDSFYSCLEQWLSNHALCLSDKSHTSNFYARILSKQPDKTLSDIDVNNIKHYFEYLTVLDCYDVSPVESHH